MFLKNNDPLEMLKIRLALFYGAKDWKGIIDEEMIERFFPDLHENSGLTLGEEVDLRSFNFKNAISLIGHFLTASYTFGSNPLPTLRNFFPGSEWNYLEDNHSESSICDIPEHYNFVWETSALQNGIIAAMIPRPDKERFAFLPSEDCATHNDFRNEYFRQKVFNISSWD